MRSKTLAPIVNVILLDGPLTFVSTVTSVSLPYPSREEMAWFRFAYGTMFISFGVVTLSIFYRARKAFEIRAR